MAAKQVTSPTVVIHWSSKLIENYHNLILHSKPYIFVGLSSQKKIMRAQSTSTAGNFVEEQACPATAAFGKGLG